MHVSAGEYLAGLTPDEANRLARINVEVSERHLEDDPDKVRSGFDRIRFQERSGNLAFLLPLLSAVCPARTVVLKAYRIARRPVLDAQFAEFCRRTGRTWHRWRPAPANAAMGISFEDAAAYAASVGARLPTPAEWERAARGPLRWCFPWGPDWTPAADAMMDRWYAWPPGRLKGLESPEGCLDFVTRQGEWCAGDPGLDPEAWSVLAGLPNSEFAPGRGVLMGRDAGPLIPNAVVPNQPSLWTPAPGRIRLACDAPSV